MNELLYYDLKDASGVAPGLATQVSRELGRRIVGGHYKEDALIEDENKLCDRFGVSKSVVREAVKLLVGKGLLEVRRGSGTRVRRRPSWAMLDDDVLAWHLSVDPKPDFLRQLMDIRRMMEPKAAAWAAEFGSDEALREIEVAQVRMEEEQGSVQDFVVADALFHRAILRAANNELLRSMEGVIFSALLSSIKLTNADPRENESSIPFHRGVRDAICIRDSKAAEQKMHEHLVDTSDRLSAAIKGFDRPERN
ncbi:GntR family transcriptional regulator [Octadecabacter antarcticus 307]|uniref:GntR family transcriptional regulator n=1 Tax=Octadecabacter antarcticus 307 TaxID=391626 RepID=M9R4M9_9RHOB|nr:FadR/GntR family transcriptional regulator [Octadecabacter antarcticus]AGI67574.1 GntR family transcriptional regulator [Octadecabacter antarcticus 307]